MEKLAPIYTNSDKTLWFIEPALYCFKDLGANCIFQQAANTVYILSGSVPRLSNNVSASCKGHTPKQVVNYLKRWNAIDVSTKGYPDIDDALEDVSKGQPVLMVVSNDNPCWSQTDYLEGDAIVTKFSGNILKKPSLGYHAYMIWGMDVGKGNVLLRESSTSYGNNGYFQIPLSLIKSSPKSAAFFSFVLG